MSSTQNQRVVNVPNAINEFARVSFGYRFKRQINGIIWHALLNAKMNSVSHLMLKSKKNMIKRKIILIFNFKFKNYIKVKEKSKMSQLMLKKNQTSKRYVMKCQIRSNF